MWWRDLDGCSYQSVNIWCRVQTPRPSKPTALLFILTCFLSSEFLPPLLMNSSLFGLWWQTHNVTFISLDPNHTLRKNALFNLFLSNKNEVSVTRTLSLFHSSKQLGCLILRCLKDTEMKAQRPPALVFLMSSIALHHSNSMILCWKDTCHLTEEQCDLNCSWHLDIFQKHSIFWNFGKNVIIS